MRRLNLTAYALAAFFVLIWASSGVQAANVQVLTTFDFPEGGLGSLSASSHINNNGDVAGTSATSGNEVVTGFVRFADGSFLSPIVAPNDNVNDTRAFGINTSGTVVGIFIQADEENIGTAHGFILDNENISQFDVPGADETFLLGINDFGQVVGSAVISEEALSFGFVTVGSSVETFSFPGAITTSGTGVNNLGQVVGFFIDADINAPVRVHGFIRQPDGTLTAIDFPDAVETTVRAINDQGNNSR